MASANTLTNLIPDMYEALDTVSRELVGFIPAVTLDANASRAAVGQTVRSPVAPAASAADITPASVHPDTGGQSIGNKAFSITKSRMVPLQWTGEEQAGVNAGIGHGRLFQMQVAQAMRTLTNEVEQDIGALHTGASRAYGTAGTTPFGSTLGDPAQMRKILSDNGNTNDMQLVIDSTAGAAVRTLAQLTKVNEGGDSQLLRQGELLNIHGFSLRESAGVRQAVAVGAMASATTTAAALTVGQTVLPLATAGTGVVAAGDIITLANDTNKYVIASVSFAGANPAAGDTITIQQPGLRVAQAAAARAITVIAAATRNMAFNRSSIVLLARAPMVPTEGDSADDSTIITDPRSGLSFEMRLYKGYRQVRYELGLAWGAHIAKNEHIGLLLG